jgi:sporulation protein YlmC with PRC-barrel domain
MRLELGSAVHGSDGPFGELADIVIDPTTRRVTHLIVEPEHRHDLARLVPADRAHDAAPSDAGIVLDYTVAEISRLERVQRSAYLRLGQFPVEDPDWQVGIENILALPYYEILQPGGLGTTMPPIGLDQHITEIYDRVPKDTIEVRRESAVLSSDGHPLGRVDGFVVDGEEQITHLVLEHGHLWGKREITIPISAVAAIKIDEVSLSLSKDQVAELPSVSVHRWASR